MKNGHLASGDSDGIINIWNTGSGGLIRTLNCSRLRSLVVLENGYLVCGSFPEIKIWNIDNGGLIRNITGHTDDVLSLAVLTSGYLASSSYDRSIRVWDTRDGSLIRTLKGHVNSVLALVVLSNGYLASASEDRTIKIWNFNQS